MNREAIITALIAKLKTLADFTTVAREWKGANANLTTDSLPALYLIERPESHKVSGRNMPAKVDLSFDIVLVVAKPQGVDGLAAINPMLDKLDTVLIVPPGLAAVGQSTLGGLAVDTWIEGNVVKNPAFLSGGACLAVVPLHVRTTQ